MTGTQLTTRIRYLTKQDSVTLADADLLPIVNTVKDAFAEEIIKRNEEYFIIPAFQDLVASTVTVREYPLPDDLLSQLATVELALDTSNPTVYIACLPFKGGLQRLVRELNGITESKITNYFTNQAPQYYLTRRGIYILSGTISALSNGLKIRYRLYPADLANLTGSTDLSIDPTTTSFGLPKQFHELWARAVSIEWKGAHPGSVPLSEKEKNFANDFQAKLDSISDDDLGAETFGFLPVEDSPQNLGANL